MIELLNGLLRHRRILIGLPAVLAFLVIVVGVILPRTYSSSASFVPESDAAQASRLSGIAAQFGVNLAGAQGGRSPQFYADLLRSREILEAAVTTRYRPTAEVEADESAGNLIDLYEVEGDSPGLRLARSIERLRNRLTVQTTPETGVIRFEVETRWPWLALQIADRLVELVNEFNLETRQSQAQAEREFLEGRLRTARMELRTAEDSLERFLESNRSYRNSPSLRFEHDRLQRRVTLQQQVVTSLAQSYEQARIDEVRDTPVITVVKSPHLPPKPDRRWLLVKGVVAGLIGLLLAAMWAFGSHVFAEAKTEQHAEYERFRRLLNETRSELRRVWSLIIRGGGAGAADD